MTEDYFSTRGKPDRQGGNVGPFATRSCHKFVAEMSNLQAIFVRHTPAAPLVCVVGSWPWFVVLTLA